ncbi:SDR family NAD(P)-dependent oxidoreductase [bacterium]|nr:MAG: SDR family NAD(P)-dependent oxidoreductase [bacterium]
MKVHDKIWIVTGAGSGMGRELTVQLVQKGAKVAMVDIHSSALDETESLVKKGSVSKHVLDISDLKHVQKLPESVLNMFGQIDGLINNAGIIQPFIPINELEFSTIEKVFNVNFYGMVNMTKTFLPYLLKRPEAHIANVSSMGGFIPFPGQSVYSASKAAVKIFTEGLYSELKDTNVKVTVIHPGAVNTNISSNSGLEMPKTDATNNTPKSLDADKAAAIMISAIEKNAFRVMVGSDAQFLDKLYRFNPKYAVDFIVKKMGAFFKK